MKPIFRTKRRPQNRETAWPGRFKGPILEPRFPQPRGQNVTSGSTKKLYGCGQALKVSLEFSYQTHSRPRFCSDRETAGPGRFTKPIFRTKRTPQNRETAWPGRLTKQHGLASSRSPVFDLAWGDLQCQTLRPEPIKTRQFLPLRGSFLCWGDLQCQTLRPELIKKERFLPLQGLLRALFRTWT